MLAREDAEQRFLRALAEAAATDDATDHEITRRLIALRDVRVAAGLSPDESLRAAHALERDGLIRLPRVGWVQITITGLQRARCH